MDLFDFPSWLRTASTDFLKLAAAGLLTLPIAYNRERSTQIMGIRTFPLVSVATCSFLLIAQSFLGDDSTDAQARIIQGILAGIGFIGGGALLKKEDRVLGTATAASIWLTGAVGIAIAYSRYDIAVFLIIFNFLILRWVTPLKKIIHPLDEEESEENLEAADE